MDRYGVRRPSGLAPVSRVNLLIRSKLDMPYNSNSGALPVFIKQRTEYSSDSMPPFSTDFSVRNVGNFDAIKEKQPYLPTPSNASISKKNPSPDTAFPTLPQPILDLNASPFPPCFIPDRL